MNDLTGMRFGSLTVISPTNERNNNSVVWLCRCDCGKEVTASSKKLLENLKKSCGCRWITNGKYANGKSPKSKLCGAWAQLKQRCGNPNNKDYRYYGARGVTVCEEWQSFRGFEAWALNNGYREGLTIDRIDGNGDYNPDNCQWISQKENCRKQHRTPKKYKQTA